MSILKRTAKEQIAIEKESIIEKIRSPTMYRTS